MPTIAERNVVMTPLLQQHESIGTQLKRVDARLALWLSADLRALLDHKAQALQRAGVGRGSLTVGDRAPDFRLPDSQGRILSLSRLLEAGPVVLTFYHGAWNPYCSVYLRALQASLPEIEQAGGALVAVSPDTPAVAAETARKNGIGFPLLCDSANWAARQYGLVFELPRFVRSAFARVDGAAVKPGDGQTVWLPVPATYAIDRDGVIRYASTDPDFRTRPEPAEVIEALGGL